MKKIISNSWIFLLLAFVAYNFIACDVVDDPYPAKDPVIETPTDTTTTDTTAVVTIQDKLDSIETAHGIPAPVKKVLLEDYTGHTCGNCPRAAEIATSLKKQNPRLVVMAVHVGYFAKTKNDGTGKYAYDFTTNAGNQFDSFYKIDQLGLPQGMVNRVKQSGASSAAISHGAWSTAVAAEFAKAPVFNLTITNVYDAATRKVNLKVRSEALTALQGDYRLGVYVVEDSIVNWQKDYSKSPADIEFYMHRHALRTDVNGAWGESVVQNPAAGEVASKYYDVTLHPSWKPKNCSLIAFVYKESTKEILQAEEHHLQID
ncbi:MAG: Omp28 family outer membrane lipoprotein [Hymenobacteraceae bacterium]|nr:Omp28 family outer membrane lipoprotein [Hymenobacteraceae bacterium]MDX5396951.1 Omp28 family outer membrane lipoprotein [Hymenobacteraceae bacterium]MDX5443322.1 Omp28 family outer membrane lipoprotein [Hymenobacteraceae bacterium]MDX5513025.1 Omp28 family outer membrane lipoprotein [Hymenobacteraceae bacterium]